ncbi:MAG: four helix bundle protein [Phaeodactylibacter sp.]|nr:four helix bundle protein [Phaeodactylibacter sp.]
MKKMTKEEFAKWMCQRTKNLAVRVVKFCQTLPYGPATKVVVYQLIKAATSTAGNYRAACRARSKAEFFSKISIVVEEADETLFWLEIMDESKFECSKKELGYLAQEALEILSIVVTARKNTNRN